MKGVGRTLASPVALVLLVVLAGGSAVAAGIAGGALAAIAAGGAMALLWLMVVVAVGMRRAQHEFYAAYAAERGLTWSQQGGIPPTTELLRRGDRRRADHSFSGTLPGGLDGTIALYTYR